MTWGDSETIDQSSLCLGSILTFYMFNEIDTSINLKSIINSRLFGWLKMKMWLFICVLGLASGQQDFQDLLDQVYIVIDRTRSLLDFIGLGLYWIVDKPAINQLLFDL